MPIWIWGVLAMIFSAFIIIAPFFLPTQKLNNTFNYLICIGVGVMLAFTFNDIR